MWEELVIIFSDILKISYVLAVVTGFGFIARLIWKRIASDKK